VTCVIVSRSIKGRNRETNIEFDRFLAPRDQDLCHLLQSAKTQKFANLVSRPDVPFIDIGVELKKQESL